MYLLNNTASLISFSSSAHLVPLRRFIQRKNEHITFFYQLLAAPEELKVNIWDGLADTTNDTKKLGQHHKREMRRAKKERRKADEKSANDKAQLQKKLRETQEAHHDYRNKLMDVVKNAHLAREAEEARLTDEFTARLEAKDCEISKLRGELSTLKKAVDRN